MRGKKVDSEFISHFITDCASGGKNSPEDIVKEAKIKIENIDSKIKETEKLKVIRSKLIDVVSTLEKTNKPSQDGEIKILSLFRIQNPHICKFICDKVKITTASVNSVVKSEYNSQDVLFAIKQLIEHKIILRVGDHLIKGESFVDYLNYVLLDKNEHS